MENMTLDQYILNPLGKTNAVLSGAIRESLKASYDLKYHNVLLRENGKINYFAYHDRKNNVYYIHVKAPSENVKDFYYDVVFKFFTDASVEENGRNLSKWFVNFYSNDPAFVYTYAYAFAKKGLLIPELYKKMSPEALKTEPKEKNPDGMTYYSKIIYFGYLFMKDRGLLNTIRLGDAQNYDPALLLGRIMHADQKIAERQEAEKNISHKKKILVNKDTLRQINRIGVSDQAKERLITTTNKTAKVKKINAVNSTKFVKRTKKK